MKTQILKSKKEVNNTITNYGIQFLLKMVVILLFLTSQSNSQKICRPDLNGIISNDCICVGMYSYGGSKEFQTDWFNLDTKADLPDCVASTTHIKRIVISNFEDYIPKNLFKIKSLEHLEFTGHCTYSSIPKDIGNLTNLKVLVFNFGSDKEKSIPKELGNCIKLEELKIDAAFEGRFIKSIPEEWGKLVSIKDPNKILNLCDQNLQSIPKSFINLYKNKSYLSLWGFGVLDKLPDGITELVNLKQLNLQACTSLKQLPSSIGKLKNLELLNMSYCESITSLPKEIGDLKKLKVLDLSGCRLTDLPPSFYKLAGNLNELNLQGNRLPATVLKKVANTFYQIRLKY